MVCLALELVVPWVVIGFSVGMEALGELLSIFPGFRSSLVFSGFDLSLLPLVFSLILTVASRLLPSVTSKVVPSVLASSVC